MNFETSFLDLSCKRINLPTKWHITHKSWLINQKTVADFVHASAKGKMKSKLNSATGSFFQFGFESGKLHFWGLLGFPGKLFHNSDNFYQC
jgi:hypothetical protein